MTSEGGIIMSEEKMLILKMLEEGKISSEEAATLLSSLKDTPKPSKTTSSSSTRPQSQQPPNQSLDWVRELEPKVQKAAQTVARTTSHIVDKIVKTLSETDFKNAGFGNQRGEKELNLALKVMPQDHLKLFLKGKNGSIALKGYNGDQINLKVFYRNKEETDHGIRLVQMDQKIFLQYEEDQMNFVRMEGFIPEAYFHTLHLETSNSNIRVDSCKANDIHILTSNAKVEVKEVDSAKVHIETSNAPIKTQLYANQFVAYSQYQWYLETSNAPIEMITPTGDIGYRIKALTSLSGIQTYIPHLTYTQSEGNYIEAQTLHYERASKKVDLNLTTSNASIVLK